MKLLLACVTVALGAFAFQEPAPEPSHDKAPDQFQQALALLRENKRDEGIKVLQDLLAKDPAAEKPSAVLAQMLLFKERFDEADAVINAAVKTHPDAASLHAVRGDIVFREGQPFEADAEYKLTVKLDAKNAHGYYGEARVFDMASLRNGAAVLYRKAHELEPKNPIYETKVFELDANSPANIDRWAKRLSEPNLSGSLAGYLLRRIATAKVLNGRPAFSLSSAYTDYQMPLSAATSNSRLMGIALNVAIGREKTKLEVDTGAPGLIISSRFAKHAGVQRIADSETGGIGNTGNTKGWVGYVEKIEIGGLEFRDCIVEVSDKMEMNDQDGLIGTNIFRRFLVKINLHDHKLELSPLPGPAWDGVQAVDRQILPNQNDFAQVLIFGHELLIPGKISEEAGVDQSPGLFLIDTGASRNFLSTRVAAEVTKVRDDDAAHVHGLSGSVKKVYKADKVVLEFAKFRQPNLDMLAVDLTNPSRRSGTEVAAILGFPVLNIFRSITLDYRDGMVKFEYKP